MLFHIRVYGLICFFVYVCVDWYVVSYTCVWTDMLFHIRVYGLICFFVYVCMD